MTAARTRSSLGGVFEVMNPTAPRPIRRGSLRIRAVGTLAATALACLVLVSGPARAASPGPSGSPSTDPGVAAGFDNLEVWLDRPLPRVAATGSTLPIGLMIWDKGVGRPAAMGGLYLHLKPAQGKAKATSAETQSDFPGHFLANIIVPAGGPGSVEVGVTGRSCSSDGTCSDAEFPFKVVGTGPPPDAPRSGLISAIVHVPTAQVPAGEPMDIGVDVTPRAKWADGALVLPDRLIVAVTLPDRPDIATTELLADPSAPGAYRGSIAIADAGDVALLFAFPVNGQADDVIEQATTRVRIVGAVASPATPSGEKPAPAPVGDQPPWVLIGGGLVAVVAAGFVIRRAFADL